MTEYLRDLVVKDEMGQDHFMHELLKRVTLIVNVDCKVGGESNNECPGLEALYLKYKDQGFEILAFPCDQFQIGGRAHCSAQEVKQDLAKRYHVTFPIMHKVNVNGETAHPLFIYLQKRLSGFPTDAIKWDFTKFLVVNDEPKKRYAPTVSPQSIETEIAHYLGVSPEGASMHISSPIDVGESNKSFTNEPWQQGYRPSEEFQNVNLGGQQQQQQGSLFEQQQQPQQLRDVSSAKQYVEKPSWLGGGVATDHPAYGGSTGPSAIASMSASVAQTGHVVMEKLSQGMQQIGLTGQGQQQQGQQMEGLQQRKGIQMDWMGGGVSSSHLAYGGSGMQEESGWRGRSEQQPYSGESYERQQPSSVGQAVGQAVGKAESWLSQKKEETLGSGDRSSSGTSGLPLQERNVQPRVQEDISSRQPQQYGSWPQQESGQQESIGRSRNLPLQERGESFETQQQPQWQGSGGQQQYLDSQKRAYEQESQRPEGREQQGQSWLSGGVSSGQPGLGSGISRDINISPQQQQLPYQQQQPQSFQQQPFQQQQQPFQQQQSQPSEQQTYRSTPYEGRGIQGHGMSQGVGQGTHGLVTSQSKYDSPPHTGGIMSGPSYGSDYSPVSAISSHGHGARQQEHRAPQDFQTLHSQVEVPQPTHVSDVVQNIEHGQNTEFSGAQQPQQQQSGMGMGFQQQQDIDPNWRLGQQPQQQQQQQPNLSQGQGFTSQGFAGQGLSSSGRQSPFDQQQQGLQGESVPRPQKKVSELVHKIETGSLTGTPKDQ